MFAISNSEPNNGLQARSDGLQPTSDADVRVRLRKLCGCLGNFVFDYIGVAWQNSGCKTHLERKRKGNKRSKGTKGPKRRSISYLQEAIATQMKAIAIRVEAKATRVRPSLLEEEGRRRRRRSSTNQDSGPTSFVATWIKWMWVEHDSLLLCSPQWL